MLVLSTRFLVVSAFLAAITTFPHLALAQQQQVDGNPPNSAEAAASGYASYVSAMEKQQSINDLKETATYSWARVSYKNAESTQKPDAIETQEQTVSARLCGTPRNIRLKRSDQIEATPSTSSDDLSAAPAAATQQSIADGAGDLAQDSNSDSASKNMMPIGIGIAFGVLVLLVGLVGDGWQLR